MDKIIIDDETIKLETLYNGVYTDEEILNIITKNESVEIDE